MDNRSEVMAWHGTSLVPAAAVALTGLDVNCSKSGCYGAGLYASSSPKFCDMNYSGYGFGSHRSLLYVKFLVGNALQLPMHRNVQRTHPSLDKDGVHYDSIEAAHGDGNTDMYVVYENCQAFVGYVVTYSR